MHEFGIVAIYFVISASYLGIFFACEKYFMKN